MLYQQHNLTSIKNPSVSTKSFQINQICDKKTKRFAMGCVLRYVCLCVVTASILTPTVAMAAKKPAKLRLDLPSSNIDEKISLQLLCQQKYKKPQSTFIYGMSQVIEEGDKIIHGKEWQLRNGSVSLNHSLRFSLDTPVLRRTKARVSFIFSYNKGALSVRI